MPTDVTVPLNVRILQHRRKLDSGAGSLIL